MTMPQWKPILISLLVSGGPLAGCALTSKAELVHIRYFTPERISGERSQPAGAAGPDLRLGKVGSGSNLRERIAYRSSEYELGYHEDFRWTERPEVYVRRALSRSLFEVHGFRRAFDLRVPTLSVEVVAFNQLYRENAGAARIELAAILADEDGVIWEKTSIVERPTVQSPPTIEGFVEAMGQALVAAAEALAQDVRIALQERRQQRDGAEAKSR